MEPLAPLPFPVACRIAEHIAVEYGFAPDAGAISRSYGTYRAAWWRGACLWDEHCGASFHIYVTKGGDIAGECESACPTGRKLLKKEVASLRRRVVRFGIGYLDGLRTAMMWDAYQRLCSDTPAVHWCHTQPLSPECPDAMLPPIVSGRTPRLRLVVSNA